MTRLFVSLYLGLLSAIFVFFIIAHLINTYLYVDVENIIRAENFISEVALLEELDAHITPQRRQILLDKIAEHNQSIITAVELDTIPEHIQLALQSQQAWFDDEEFDYFKAFTPVRYFQVKENINHTLLQIDEKVSDITLLTLVSLIALSCFTWLFGLHQKLKKIESTLVNISQGDLSARAPTKRRFQVGRVNTCLNEMADQMQKILGSHKQLTHVIAHEFRSPLFRMQMILEMLLTAKSENNTVHIKALEDEIFALEDLVDELLSYAKMERAELKLQLEETPIGAYLQGLHEKLLIECKHHLKLTHNTAPTFNALIDNTLIERCITNLVKNADKYGGTKIYLSASVAKNTLLFCVEDNGEGIDIEYRSSIFQPFHQLTNKDKSLGFGLGLAIVNEIMILHSGQVTVTDSEYGGSKFTLVLPIKI
ncbi:ATP-binding protein [Pseudoalteromonas sp. S558]|uniref:ATP-binding protein n=1 Tax=Pseudoalteromonas sp. S558 TaxID=2066515 RepID=UPI00110B0B43|nr:ATP-binding protein [Pseudoalteromonas sp. S558]TMO08559.1 hypothetical protein CWB66_02930 [Pseudoalteromonas sp. S558]